MIPAPGNGTGRIRCRSAIAVPSVLTVLAAAAVLVTGPRADAAEPPSVAVVGDSISYEAVYAIPKSLEAERRLVFHHSDLGLNLRDALPAVREWLGGSDGPDVLVTVIGTSQAEHEPPERWRADLRGFLDAVTPHVDCVRVFDIQERPTGFYTVLDRNGRAYNDVTQAVVADFPTVEVFHYSTWAALAGPEVDAGDGLHHTPAGERAVGRLVADAASGCDPAVTSGPFWDVPDDHPAAGAIAWIGATGLDNGYLNGTYRAEIDGIALPVTRGRYAAMLWRLAGVPAGHPPHPFTDTPRWLDPAISWAHGTGTATGHSDGTFRPGVPIARGEALAQLWRLSGSPTGHPPHPFTDIPRRLDGAVRWATATDRVAAGTGDSFRPGAPLTRAQGASLLFRHHRAVARAAAPRTIGLAGLVSGPG